MSMQLGRYLAELALIACAVTVGMESMAEDAEKCCESDTACAVHDEASAVKASEVPIACTVTDPEERAARTKATNSLVAAALEIVEVDEGYRLQFDDENTQEVVDYVQYERGCCAFFRFAIEFEPNHGPIWLSVTGSPAAKLFMRDMFTRNTKAVAD